MLGQEPERTGKLSSTLCTVTIQYVSKLVNNLFRAVIVWGVNTSEVRARENTITDGMSQTAYMGVKKKVMLQLRFIKPKLQHDSGAARPAGKNGV